MSLNPIVDKDHCAGGDLRPHMLMIQNRVYQIMKKATSHSTCRSSGTNHDTKLGCCSDMTG